MSENERYVLTPTEFRVALAKAFLNGQNFERGLFGLQVAESTRDSLAEFTPQPDALHDAAVKAAREWYGRVTALQPLPIQPGTLEHVIILKGRDAAEWHFAAQVRSFRVQFEIEARRLIDAATAALGRAEGAAGREG